MKTKCCNTTHRTTFPSLTGLWRQTQSYTLITSNWQGEKFQANQTHPESVLCFSLVLVWFFRATQVNDVVSAGAAEWTSHWLHRLTHLLSYLLLDFWEWLECYCEVPYSHCFAIMDPVEKPSILLLRHKLKLPCDAIKVLELWRLVSNICRDSEELNPSNSHIWPDTQSNKVGLLHSTHSGAKRPFLDFTGISFFSYFHFNFTTYFITIINIWADHYHTLQYD